MNEFNTIIDGIAALFRKGKSRAEAEAAAAAGHIQPLVGQPPATIKAILDEAERRASQDPSKLVETPQKPAKALGGISIEELLQELEENDVDELASPQQIEAVAQVLRQKLTEAEFALINQSLRKKSGGLTWEDVAFIAVVHRDSVTRPNEPHYQGTSPFKRIKQAAVKFGFRETPYDDRQLRYALAILQQTGFTQEVKKGIPRRGKSPGVAGVWKLLPDPLWDSLWGQPKAA